MARTEPNEFCATVLRREELTPTMVRIVFGGDGLRGWSMDGHTDSYLVLWYPPAQAPYAAPFEVDQIKTEFPAEAWPAHRHYSVRRWDPVRGELWIDFVVHGDEGLAGPWARAARPGDQIMLTLPGGGYRPDLSADWHLLVGDESAFPAIAAALEVLPEGTRAVAVLLCDGPNAELSFDTAADLQVIWLHRSSAADSAERLVETVRRLPWPGRVHAFVHGEAGEIRAVRRHLFADRAVPRQDVSVSGYWRRHLNDEAWRRIKRKWNAEVEQDVPAASS
jgi:NADPH-dependent ferric siderophore reductase